MDATRRQAWVTAAACGAVLVAFVALAGSAVATKGPTMDEPVHVLSGWIALRQGDYRLETTNPALWKLWAALGNAFVTPPLDKSGPIWQPVAWATPAELPWSRRALFDTPGTDGAAFVGRARAMMLIVGAALGAAVAAWAYRLAGPVAAVVAVCLFAFDPTVLGQAPLVKGDVGEGLAMLGLGWATWRFGQRATVARAVALGLTCGAAVTVKFSGLLAGPLLIVLLAARALAPTAWPALRGVANTRASRLIVAAAGGLVAAAVCLALVWGCYRFRYRPAPDLAAAVDLPAIWAVAGEGSGLTATTRWIDDHRLLPQAYTAGVLLQAISVRQWPAFLDGQIYDDGRWYYFPLAAAYKTPLAEMAAVAVAALIAIASGLRRPWRRPGVAWAGTCVGGPALALGTATLATRLNIGLRNALPIYPYADVMVGVAAAWAWRRAPRRTAVVAIALIGGQALAAVAGWPDFVAYFNGVVGGPRGGASHLADGNLDWGQDIPALVQWQRSHASVPLYADLFTSVDPGFYGLRYQKIWERTTDGRPRLNLPPGPAVLAVSVTHLQGLYVDPAQRPLLAQLAAQEPIDVLHGTIRLYAWPMAVGKE